MRENAFVSAYRKSTKDGKFTVKVEYISCGDLEGKVLLLVDPMLATGSSLVLAYKALCEKGGTPKYTHVAAVIASEQGIDYVQKNMPRKTTTIWAAAVDEELTSRCYIVPGIGDAGDLAYGEKVWDARQRLRREHPAPNAPVSPLSRFCRPARPEFLPSRGFQGLTRRTFQPQAAE